MAEGWIKLHRKLLDNSLWTCEPFTRGQAWVDLILLANHEYGFFFKRGVKVEVQRGQVGISEVGLSDRWRWSRTKVRKFIKDLEKEQQITHQQNNVTQVVTILKYDEYQQKEQQTIQQKDSRKTPKEQQKDINKNDKNKENEKNNKDVTYNFDFSFLNSSFYDLFIKWLDYKSARKEKYKTQESVELCYKKLLKFARSDIGTATQIIEDAMANNYAGFFEPKQTTKKQEHPFVDFKNDKHYD